MRQLQSKGFVLATMVIMSTTMIIIAVAILQTIISITNTYNDNYYTSVATQAAEAGIAVANTCATANNNSQSWTSPLTPTTDCTGTGVGSTRAYILDQPNVKSRFSVGNLVARIDGALIIKSTGTVEMRSSTGWTTRNVVVNQMVTWPATFTGSSTASGWERTCGIISQAAYCWGSNQVGQLGDNKDSGDISDVPVRVRQDVGVLRDKVVTNIKSGHSHNCVIAGTGTAARAYCWGYNEYGQLGLGSGEVENKLIPVQVGLPTNSPLYGKTITDIGTSSMSTCAIADGEIYCWGRNNSGQLGNGTTNDIPNPVPVKVGGNLPATATELMTGGAGVETMCAIVGGDAYCWGKNQNGQLGVNDAIDRSIPTAVVKTTGLQGKTVTEISVDGEWGGGGPRGGHTCAIASSVAYCWGANRISSTAGTGQSGELGINSTGTGSSTPRAVVTTVMQGAVTDIIAGARHSCAIADATVYCWGSNIYGQLGNDSYPNTYNSIVPVKVLQEKGKFRDTNNNIIPVTQLGGGFNRACAVANTRTYCWGNNSTGQIGDGTTGNIRDKPTESTFLRPKAPIFLF